MTAEGMKNIFDWSALILGFLTVVAGVGILITGNIINTRQAQQLRQFDKNLTDAKAALAGQQTELAKQQERAANAETRLLELQERISWRTPDRSLISKLSPTLERFAGQPFCVIVDQGNPENLTVLSWINLLLSSGKWKFETARSNSELQFIATNIVLWVSPNAPKAVLEAAHAAVPALERGGLPAVVFKSSWGSPPDAAPTDLIRVVVFKKGPRMKVTETSGDGGRIEFDVSPEGLPSAKTPPTK
jgi:hypothetical protein